jgi:MoxR-like ATPase
MSEKSPGQPNFYEVSKERQALRRILNEAQEADLSEPIISSLSEEKDRLDATAKDFSIAGLGGLGKAKEFLRRQREGAGNGVNEEAIRSELGGEYDILKSLSDKLDDLSDFEFRRLREGVSDPYAKRVQGSLLMQIKKEKGETAAALLEKEKSDPNTARAFELISLREGLFEEGHIAHTPSVKQSEAEIGRRMIHGKPMFLHGPTGTGKTSLARSSAKRLTGRDPEMVYCTPQTRDAHIWGKTGIRAEGDKGAIRTVDIFGPLTRAMTVGSITIFDEFTALPREQMVFFKGVANAKHGDTITIPGNGEVTIKPGFQMIFTANLKSEKNPERQELPPEIAREFEQNNLEVKYTPKNEAYDIMLARLMKPDGTLTMSWYDLTTTLPKLCEAMEEIQLAYADMVGDDTARLVGAMSAAGKKPGLKKFVMTQGTIEAIFESWETERQLNEGISFAEFVDNRLATGLTFKEYPEGDRVLAAKLLAVKGFLRTKTAADLGLPGNVFNFDAARQLRGQADMIDMLRADSAREVTLTLREVADLDPFNVRGKTMQAAADDLAGAGETGATAGVGNIEVGELTQTNEQFLLNTFTGWYDANKAVEAKQEAILVAPDSQDYKTLSESTEPTEFGKYTLNPETQGIDFERLQAFIPDLSSFNGKPLYEVMKHVNETYGDRYYVPGIEYWKWLCENPGKNPPDWLADAWDSDYRVVLLEK